MAKKVKMSLENRASSANCGACFICAAVLLVGAGLLVFYPRGYLWFVYEDGVLEWAQCYFLLAALVIALRAAGKGIPHRPFLVLIALCCFYVFGEEISWGQRIFDFSSPELFLRFNLQHETNLHNFVVGPYSTPLKRWSEWLIFSVLILAVVYRQPWAQRIAGVRRLQQRHLPPPPAYLSVFLLIAAVFELRWLGVNEAEIAELFLYFSAGVYALWCTKMTNFLDDGESCAVNQLAKSANGLFISGIVAGALLTAVLSQVPHIRQHMEARFDAGRAQFVHRYQRLGLVKNSELLYRQLVMQHPGDPGLLRDFAQLRRVQGDEAGWRTLLQQAVASDRRRLSLVPQGVEVHLSLFESFAQLGLRDQASLHIQQATALAVQEVEGAPSSAEAAYWLGRVFELVGKTEQAQAQFSRAIRLDPDAVQYRKADYRIKLH